MWNDDVALREQQKRCLRDDAAYIGIMLLAVEGAFTFLGGLLNLLISVVSMDMTTYLLCYAIVYSIGLAVPAVLVSRLVGHRYCPLTPCNRLNALDAFLGILAAVGGCMVANIVSSYVASFLESLGAERPDMPDFLQPTILSLLLNVVVFAVLPALLEELVFRGYVLRTLRAYGDWFAVAVSSVLFGLMHGNIEQIPFALVVGFALGWLYIMTDNIWLPIAVHFANNAFAYALDFASLGMDDAQRNIYYTITLMMLLVVGLGCFAVLVARRSTLLRRLPRRCALSVGARVGGVLSSPMFVVCLVVYGIVTVLGS